MCLLFSHHPKRLFVGHRMDICRALLRGHGVYMTWTCPRGLVSDIWQKKIFVEPSKVLHYTDGLCLICAQKSLLRRRTLHGYLWSCPPKFYITRTCPRGLCLICVQRSLLRRRTLHGYLWSCSPKFYITRTCPRGGHGADATDHSAVGLDQATGRPDKTEHALLAVQKA